MNVAASQHTPRLDALDLPATEKVWLAGGCDAFVIASRKASGEE